MTRGQLVLFAPTIVPPFLTILTPKPSMHKTALFICYQISIYIFYYDVFIFLFYIEI